MVTFDQHDRTHQDWLIKWAASEGITGFYEVQDLADILHGRERRDILDRLAAYRAMSALPGRDLLNWLRSQRAANGVEVDQDWQAAEDRARMSGVPNPGVRNV